MKIGIYISDLLYDHESVVLPGFGEFYTLYTPARFIPEERKVVSPSKRIAFNPDRIEGDTLLVDQLSEKQNMDKEKVRQYLSDFVSEVNQLLSEGKKVELERVGMFGPGEGGDIVFTPDLSVNYLHVPAVEVSEPPKKEPPPVSPEVTPPPVSQISDEGVGVQSTTPPPVIEKVKTPTEEKPEPTMTSQNNRQKLPPALRWIAFTVIPLLIIIIVLALNYQYFFGNRQQARTSDPAPGTVIAPQPTEPVPASPEPEAEPLPPPQAEPAAAREPAAPEPGRRVYYIVVGSFPDRAKADRLVETLRNQGASNASVFMRTGFDYHRVSYGYYYDLAEAEAILPGVKENVASDAWILHR